MRFEKVSLAQWREDAAKVYYKKKFADLDSETAAVIDTIYEGIKLPARATRGSAGYDFFAPDDVSVGSTPVDILTGIRWIVEEGDPDMVLLCMPRSGLGFKYGTSLVNTVGVIDQDYYKADNEGHIRFRMTSVNPCYIEAGKAFGQGIQTPFVANDEVAAERHGGFGSTGN